MVLIYIKGRFRDIKWRHVVMALLSSLIAMALLRRFLLLSLIYVYKQSYNLSWWWTIPKNIRLLSRTSNPTKIQQYLYQIFHNDYLAITFKLTLILILIILHKQNYYWTNYFQNNLIKSQVCLLCSQLLSSYTFIYDNQLSCYF